MRFVISGKSQRCNGTLLTSRLQGCKQRILAGIQDIFMLLESAFYEPFCLKFSFTLVAFSKSYTRKHSVDWRMVMVEGGCPTSCREGKCPGQEGGMSRCPLAVVLLSAYRI